MKKYLSYIIILTASIGMFSLVSVKQARADQCVLTGWTYASCHNGTAGLSGSIYTGTQATPAGSQETCTTGNTNMSQTTCGQDGGQWFSSPNNPPSTQEGVSVVTSTPAGSTPAPTVGGMCTGQAGTPPGCNATVNVPGSSCIVTGNITSQGVSALSLTDFEGKCGSLGGSYDKSGITIYSEKCTATGVSPQSCADVNWGSKMYYPPGVTPSMVPLADTGTYTLLAPLPCPAGSTGCSGQLTLTTLDVSGTNSLSIYLNLMIKIFIGICAVLAVIMVLWGGIEYMTSELISSKEAGKERIRDALLGLLLALGAWTLLYTINPNLLNTSFSSLQSVAADAQLGGESSLPYSPIAQSSLQSSGITCPGSGGASALTTTADSFIGHSNYSNTARNTMTGTVANVDCSSFVDQVYSCSGLTPPGNTTADIFSTCTPATNIQTSASGTTVNGVPLKVGDLLGWKAGQGGQSSGHVIMYVGNGNIIDSQQGVAVSQRPLSANMISMIQCVKPLGQ